MSKVNISADNLPVRTHVNRAADYSYVMNVDNMCKSNVNTSRLSQNVSQKYFTLFPMLVCKYIFIEFS